MKKKTKKKLTTDFGKIEHTNGGVGRFERKNNTRGPGRPIGKRSNPAFRQYTVLIRQETHTKAIEKLRKTHARPDFGEYVEALIYADISD